MSSTTSADRRGHLRQDSVARKRGPPPALAPQKQPGVARINIGNDHEPTTAGPGGVFDARTRAGGSGGTRFSLAPGAATRLIGACVVLILLFHYGPAYLFSSSSQTVAALARHRKALMAGAGESWTLPRKWRDVRAGEGEVTLNGETLPVCKRVMLFKFQGTHGFSAEVLHYLRAGVVAQKLGYTLLADDSEWNYGALSSYFLPRLVYCRPPSDWFSTDLAVRFGSRRWQGKDRVWVSREMQQEVDEWIRDEMLEPSVVDELRARQFNRVLPEGETLPAAFQDVYADFRAVLKEVWRPNPQLTTLIRKQRLELGLGGGALRHRKNSPTFGGNRRAGAASPDASQSGREEEEDPEWEYGVAERSDRGPVVGVHLAGRQQRFDLTAYGLTGAIPGDLAVVLEGAADAARRLTHSSVQAPGYSRTRPNLFPSTSTPTLVALTSNETLFSLLTSSAPADQFNVVRTSPAPYDELRPFNDILRLEVTADLLPPKGHAASILREWDQKIWNSDVPRELQILLTRYFVRDLIVLSQHADAFVVSGASPTGRLALLLAGEDGAVGPRDLNGGSYGGRVRSVDGYWVPTARAQSVFG